MSNKGDIVKRVVICTTLILLVWLTRSKLYYESVEVGKLP